MMPLYWAEDPEPDLFALGARGLVLPPPTVDNGSDIEDWDSPPPEEPATTIDSFLSQLWRQFIIDITGKSPNQRGVGKRSYLRLNGPNAQELKENLYQNLAFSQIFRKVAYRAGNRNDWERAFKWLFPQRGFRASGAIQNYLQCPYFKQWIKFLEERKNSDELVTSTRHVLWRRLRGLKWIPDAQQDKIWPTKVVNGFTHWPTPTGDKLSPAVHVLLKEHARPSFPPVMDEAVEGDD